MKKDSVDRLDVVIDESDQFDKNSAASDDESNRELTAALKNLNRIVGQLGPAVREELRDKPEALAEWESIMNDYADLLAEDEEERAKEAAEAAKEAEGLKLAADVRVALERIDADVDRLAAMDQTDLEFEAVAERIMAGIHELDIEMRLRGRDFPEQLEKWKDTMEHFADVEAIFESGREGEDSEPAN